MLFSIQDHQNRAIQLTDELNETNSPYKVPPHLTALVQKANRVLKSRDRHKEQKLKQWTEQYPDVPQFKNYLAAYYSLNGQMEKGITYTQEMTVQFPDYLFAKSSLASACIFHKEPEKVPEVLGASLDLEESFPGRKIFHFSEYVNFYKVVFEY